MSSTKSHTPSFFVFDFNVDFFEFLGSPRWPDALLVWVRKTILLLDVLVEI